MLIFAKVSSPSADSEWQFKPTCKAISSNNICAQSASALCAVRIGQYVDHWPILICLLGNFRLLKGGQPILLHHAGKTQSLLSNLALGPDYALPRERLLQAVWPDTDVALAGQSLNSLVYALRKQLSDHLRRAAGGGDR
jgi:hypothetical protein